MKYHDILDKLMEEQTLLSENREPCVGIFWMLPEGKLISDYTPSSLALRQGQYEVHNRNHFNVWTSISNIMEPFGVVKGMKYDVYPRGRVVCDTEDYTYHIFLDQCISDEFYNKIINEFRLSGHKIEFHTDNKHYKCSTCEDK